MKRVIKLFIILFIAIFSLPISHTAHAEGPPSLPGFLSNMPEQKSEPKAKPKKQIEVKEETKPIVTIPLDAPKKVQTPEPEIVNKNPIIEEFDHTKKTTDEIIEDEIAEEDIDDLFEDDYNDFLYTEEEILEEEKKEIKEPLKKVEGVKDPKLQVEQIGEINDEEIEPIIEEEKPIQAEITPKKDTKKVTVEEKKAKIPFPIKRPKNYRKKKIAKSINKRKYRKENRHLPKLRYLEEYTKLLFDSAAVGNLNTLRAMADYIKDLEIKDKEGNTPLIFALMAKNFPSTVALLGMGSNPNAQNKYGVSPLHVATSFTETDFTNILINRGARVNINDNAKRTPLMVAAEHNNAQTIEILVKNGADINAVMKNGNTALHIAVIHEAKEAALALLTFGAKTEIKNKKGYTPLMESAILPDITIPSMLLRAGADTTKETSLGKTAAQIASEYGYKKVAEIIETANIKRELILDDILKQRKYHKSFYNKKNKPEINKQPSPMKGPIPQPFFTKQEKDEIWEEK